jgi:hypothetical protein
MKTLTFFPGNSKNSNSDMDLMDCDPGRGQADNPPHWVKDRLKREEQQGQVGGYVWHSGSAAYIEIAVPSNSTGWQVRAAKEKAYRLANDL